MSRQNSPSSKDITAFQTKVLSYHRQHGRHSLPWRKTVNPYRILVSEVMLQQTQVDRVIPKYKAFVRAFPTVAKLANANLTDVLALWSGLGYNRRARMLHEAAKTIVAKHKGRFPKGVRQLEALPGIGPYTARAVAVFAYNSPEVLIETNVRSVFINEFFSGKTEVHDAEILPLIATALVRDDARSWYAALMDYGSELKKATPNPSRRSKHHTKQSKFDGSLRQIRGSVLPLLFKEPKTTTVLVRESGFEKARVEDALVGLVKDGMVRKRGRAWEIAT